MRSNSLYVATLAIFAISLSVLAPPPAAAAAKDGQKFGDWVARCDANACRVAQAQVNSEGGRLFEISFLKSTPKGDMAFMALVPLGVMIQPGTALVVDSKPLAAPILKCLPNGCQTGAVLDQATLKSLPKAKEVALAVANGEGKTINFMISTKGLGDALDAIR